MGGMQLALGTLSNLFPLTMKDAGYAILALAGAVALIDCASMVWRLRRVGASKDAVDLARDVAGLKCQLLSRVIPYVVVTILVFGVRVLGASPDPAARNEGGLWVVIGAALVLGLVLWRPSPKS